MHPIGVDRDREGRGVWKEMLDGDALAGELAFRVPACPWALRTVEARRRHRGAPSTLSTAARLGFSSPFHLAAAAAAALLGLLMHGHADRPIIIIIKSSSIGAG